MPLLLAACAGTPVQPSAVRGLDDPQIPAYLSKLAQAEMRRHDVPGLSIALVDDQRIVWSQGFGLADSQSNIPATADTVYRVGSISKLFTATAVMQLSEQGALDIDQPLQRYLPAFHPAGLGNASLNARQLLTHHAGLPRDQLQGMFVPQPKAFGTAIEIVNREGLSYVPGQIFSYSNLGFSVLGSLVQQTSGVAFEQYVRQSILTPLGMKSAGFAAGPSDSPYMAKAYQGQKPATETPLRDVPAGGLNASVRDMARFMEMVFAQGRSGDQQVLSAATVSEMLRAQNTQVPLDLGFRIGLGWMLSTLGSDSIRGAGPVAHHSGATLYHRSQMYLLPEHKLGVVVLANSSTAMGVVDQVAKAAIKLALKAKTGIDQPDPRPVAWDDVALSSQQRAALPGHYTTIAGPIRIRADGAQLQVDIAGKTLRLRPRADGLWGLEYALLGLIPVQIGPLGQLGFSLQTVEGRALLIGSAGGQSMLIGERLAPASDLGAWRARLGNYALSEPDDIAKGYRLALREEQGYLVLDISHPSETSETGKLLLWPVSDERALVLRSLADAGESLHVIRVDGQERLSMSGFVAQKQ